MKKIMIGFALVALSAVTAFGAPCTGNTIAAIALAGSCEVAGAGGNSFTLNNWSLGDAGSIGYGGNVTSADVLVTTAAFGIGGFSISFSDAPGGNNYFVALNNNGTNQVSNFETRFTIASATGTAASGLATVGHALNNFNIGTPTSGNPIATANKVLNPIGGGAALSSINLIAISNGSQSSQDNAISGAPAFFQVVDSFQLNGANGNTTGASVANFTNSFDVNNPIPEPMTSLMLGAGLLGLAALRRRSS